MASLDRLVAIWIEVLSRWISEGGGDLVETVEQFLLALQSMLETGVLPPKIQQGGVSSPKVPEPECREWAEVRVKL